MQIKPRLLHTTDSLHSMDSANACGALGRRFESGRARHFDSRCMGDQPDPPATVVARHHSSGRQPRSNACDTAVYARACLSQCKLSPGCHHTTDSLHSMDSASASGALGRRFESGRVRHCQRLFIIAGVLCRPFNGMQPPFLGLGNCTNPSAGRVCGKSALARRLWHSTGGTISKHAAKGVQMF